MHIKQPRNYHTAKAGWLLACDAPSNITKGETMLATLTPKERQRAIEHCNALKALYGSVTQRPLEGVNRR